jgi:epoxide hydrolase-like predicted phosphatase
MPSNIKAVIWDMGGVLLRTDDKQSRAQIGRKYGMSADEVADLVFNQEASFKASLGLASEDEIWEHVALKLNLDEKELPEFKEAFWAGDQFDTDLINFIRSLRPTYKTALLSNAWAGAWRALTEKYNCIDVFDVAVISAEVGMMKPDPGIYGLVLAKLGVLPNQAIFIDDMQANVDAANQVGIHGIRFVSTSQVLTDIKSLLNSHL